MHRQTILAADGIRCALLSKHAKLLTAARMLLLQRCKVLHVDPSVRPLGHTFHANQNGLCQRMGAIQDAFCPTKKLDSFGLKSSFCFLWKGASFSPLLQDQLLPGQNVGGRTSLLRITESELRPRNNFTSSFCQLSS